MLSSIYRIYEGLLAEVDQEFNRVSNIFKDRMQCRKGCSSCCTQLFPISAIEAAYISRAVKGLPLDVREGMRRKAHDYLTELIGPEFDDAQSIEEHGKSVGAALDKSVGKRYIPCPVLEGDACSIYSHRPIIARKYGIPLWNPRNPRVLQACELNFKAGETIEVEGVVEPQMEMEYRWLAFKQDVHQELDLPDVVATVASAVLYDYDAFLEKRAAGKTAAQ